VKPMLDDAHYHTADSHESSHRPVCAVVIQMYYQTRLFDHECHNTQNRTRTVPTVMESMRTRTSSPRSHLIIQGIHCGAPLALGCFETSANVLRQRPRVVQPAVHLQLPSFTDQTQPRARMLDRERLHDFERTPQPLIFVRRRAPPLNERCLVQIVLPNLDEGAAAMDAEEEVRGRGQVKLRERLTLVELFEVVLRPGREFNDCTLWHDCTGLNDLDAIGSRCGWGMPRFGGQSGRAAGAEAA